MNGINCERRMAWQQTTSGTSIEHRGNNFREVAKLANFAPMAGCSSFTFSFAMSDFPSQSLGTFITDENIDPELRASASFLISNSNVASYSQNSSFPTAPAPKACLTMPVQNTAEKSAQPLLTGNFKLGKSNLN
jgi:hypothetical protein